MNARRAIVLSGLLGLVGAGHGHAETVLTMSSWVGPTHHLTVTLQQWAKDAENATNGRVKFRMLPKHPSAPPGAFDSVRDDLVDVSFAATSFTAQRQPLTMLPALPGGGETALINSVAYSRIYEKHFADKREYEGVKLLGVFTHGPGQLLAKKPVNSIADLQGMKIRTGGGIAEAVARAAGASTFVKGPMESYELLKSGVADGTVFPIESVASFKLETVITHAIIFPGGMYNTAFGVLMNEGKWNKLPKQDQEAIARASGENIARMFGKAWDEADRKGFDALKKAGVNVVTADPELAQEVRKRSEPLLQDWIKKAAAKGVDGTKVLAEFQAELKKVAAAK